MEAKVLSSAPVVPITALQFTDQFLLSGEGSYCHLYELTTWSHLAKHRIFSSSSIHGIRPDYLLKSSNLICFFGAKSIRVVKFSETLCSDIDVAWDEIRLSEWIWDCAWLGNVVSMDGSNSGVVCRRVAAVLGHNSVIQVDFESGSIVCHVQCSLSCILYSAKLIGQNWKSLMVSVGTVFNQVILWTVTGPFDELGHAEVMHTLTGHQGVVMGVDCDVRHLQLCSVSDDRSIRVWQITTPVDDDVDTTAQEKDRLSVEWWRMASFEPVHVLFGHGARIWDVRILEDGYVSIGEDAVCCLWDSSGQITQKFKGHQGRSIWSIAVNSDENLLATGGGDAGIRVWQRNSVLQLSENVSMMEIAMPRCHGDDFPRLVKLLGSSMILVMSNRGCLFKYTVPQKHWTVILNDPAYASYSVMSLDQSRSMVAIGNINGWVKVLCNPLEGLIELSEVLEKQFHKGKVHNILWLDNLKDTFLTCGQDGQMFIVQMSSLDASKKRHLVQSCELVLPPSKQRWVTSLCFVHSVSLLICGDREGSVYIYRNSGPESNDISFDCRPVQSFHRLHGPNEVTSISFHAGQIFTTGRDGNYRVFAVDSGHNLQLLSSCKVLKGLDWLSQMIFHPQDVLALGFHSRQFVAYNIGTNQCLFSVPCGGGHRAWDFFMSFSDGDCRLVYIKKRGIAFYCAKVASYQEIVKPSLHGRQITCLCHLMPCTTENGLRQFVVTGGEDGRLSVVSFPDYGESLLPLSNDAGQVLQVLSSTQLPASSVRTCCISRQSADVVDSFEGLLCRSVIFSGGSKGQLFAWRLAVSNDNAFSDCFWESLGMYSICTKSRKQLKPWKQHLYNPEVETRFMHLSAFCLDDVMGQSWSHFHAVVAVCSVGIVRLLSFDENSRVFRLMASSSFHANCLLRVKHFVYKDRQNGSSVYVASAGTDGRIALWDITETLLNFCSRPLAANSSTNKIRVSNKTKAMTSQSLVSKSNQRTINVQSTEEFSFDALTSNCDQESETDREKSSSSPGELLLKKSNSISEDLSAGESSSEASYSLGSSSNEDLDATENCGDVGCGTSVLSADQSRVVDFGEPVCILKAHQSGINSLDIVQCQGKSGLYAVASGGDDTALHLFILDLSSDGSVAVVGEHLCTSAHCAQVTGIRFLDDRMLVSASVDQHMILWVLEGDLPDLKLRLVRSIYSDVADISDLEFWTNKKDCRGFQVLVAGLGLQHFSVQL